jgi:membrane associated rhomboid family serine protease
MATYIIIIAITSLISISAFYNAKYIDDLIMWPALVSEKKQYYRFITSGLVHADWMHLIFNMLTLYFFGGFVEGTFNELFGKGVFLLFYILALIASDIPTYFKYRNNFAYRSLGASGAIAAVLFASIIFDPWAKIYLFFVPIGIPAFIFGAVYLVYCAYMGRRGIDGINHDAHFFGAVFGVAFVIILRPQLIHYFFSQLMR